MMQAMRKANDKGGLSGLAKLVKALSDQCVCLVERQATQWFNRSG